MSEELAYYVDELPVVHQLGDTINFKFGVYRTAEKDESNQRFVFRAATFEGAAELCRRLVRTTDNGKL